MNTPPASRTPKSARCSRRPSSRAACVWRACCFLRWRRCISRWRRRLRDPFGFPAAGALRHRLYPCRSAGAAVHRGAEPVLDQERREGALHLAADVGQRAVLYVRGQHRLFPAGGVHRADVGVLRAVFAVRGGGGRVRGGGQLSALQKRSALLPCRRLQEPQVCRRAGFRAARRRPTSFTNICWTIRACTPSGAPDSSAAFSRGCAAARRARICSSCHSGRVPRRRGAVRPAPV